MRMNYSCWGAARQVTGSMHLLSTDTGYKILIDCGLDYEKDRDFNPNIRFPFEPGDIDVLLLTHAHIDHSGNIPNLVKQGFKGEIICTEPTAYLLDKLWTDSVNIMNKDSKRRKNAVKLYGYKEVREALGQVLTLNYDQRFVLNDEVDFSFFPAGHILGAASIKLNWKEGGQTKSIGFTGDLGNYGSKLIVDPTPMPSLDYLVMESTYGNRSHVVQRSAEEELLDHVIKSCVEQEGKLIIPAFSVGRTQAILYTLNKLFTTGQLPPIKVFADSPLALASTNIHNHFKSLLNEEVQASLADGMELFDFPSLSFVEGEEDLEEMSLYRRANIVVSSAGMLEGGKIQQHISENIENPLCTVLVAGFCAPGTLGAQLLSGQSMIRVRNRDRYVYARIRQTDVFSAHPDADGLKRYIRETEADSLKRLFFVHGEEGSMQALASDVQSEHPFDIVLPEKGQVFDL